MIKSAGYILIQWTWGFLQTFLGLLLFLENLRNKKNRHFWYHGALVTLWQTPEGLSLGMFVFMPESDMTDSQDRRLLRHEYGHTVQSLALGPLYLPVIGLPSVIWARCPYFIRRRKCRHISYYTFYTEKWADSWGEKALVHENVQKTEKCPKKTGVPFEDRK